MSVEMLDGATVRSFVEDEATFNRSVEERFAGLDSDKDGLLSYAEMASELMSLRVLEPPTPTSPRAVGGGEIDVDRQLYYMGLFSRFDHDGDGAVGLEEFRSEMREMMLAVANVLGFLPVQMVVEEGSLLKSAVEKELKLAPLA